MPDDELELDDSGELWLTAGPEGDRVTRCLGPVGRAARRVPAALEDDHLRLLAEWDERCRYGDACRATAGAAYLAAVGTPGRRP